MKLTRLKIHGFKSFLDAADIPIEPGVTGIVGPNGCGKSNLVEALRFVMGESSYKAMRGGGMDDVIFSGAGQRPARNIAEVTLVAERAVLPDGRDTEAVEITRRIARESGSDYRLNGREVRARDVQLLFADAATGAHSSALVRQGQVAELIAAKPEKRRGILEDAAGIAGLHARRGEAEGRLKAAEANLERLSDVMAEIDAQLEALRRQARQAVRYRKLSTEIREAEAVLHALNWEGAIAKLSEAEAQLATASAAFAAAAEAQTLSARDEAVAAARLPDLREKTASASAALQRLNLAAADLDREEARLKALRQDLTARHAQAAADLEHQAELGRDAQAALARLEEEEAKLRLEGAEAAEGLLAARGLAEEAAAAAASADAETTSATNALASALAERAARERALREAQARLGRLGEEHKAVTAQRDRLQADHGAAGDREKAALVFAEAEAHLAELENQAQAAEAVAAAAMDAEQAARPPSEDADRDLNALQAEARAVAGLLEPNGRSPFAPLIDALSVAAGFETALAAALGEDLEASLDADAPAHWGACGDGADDPALPAGSEPLSRFVSGPDRLLRRLRQVGVIAEAQAGSLSPRLAPGQRLVTREGALWRWDGLRARSGSANAGANRLQQRNRLTALLSDVEAAQTRATEASSLLHAAKLARVDSHRLESEIRGAVREARKVLEARRATLSEAERRASRIGESLSAFAGGLARIEADMDAARTDLEAAGAALAGLGETTELWARRDSLQTRLVDLRGTAAVLRLEVEKAAHNEELRLRRVDSLVTERQQWLARVGRAGERAAELSGRLGLIASELAGLAEHPESFELRRRALLSEVAGAERTAAAASDRLAEAEAGQRRAGQAARAALEAFGLAREARARDEERAIAAATRKAEIAAQIREQFGRPAHEIRSLAGLEGVAALPAAGAMETRLQRLKAERERLGGVNLRAEEEARDMETRLDTMRAEHADLESAIARLRQGIQNLNREGRERLLVAFETVNGHFQSLFQSLFGGGAAELTLTGSDDPLEAGLDIVARPPGKRPQIMTLLSGGEQALTAMSLIFAVFLTNPSPICVLDEVDAPLDDANVERFCTLLDDMRSRTDTRFLVVTHNPITMARMDRLYGVTMAEPGVSQIVSVDLEAAERFREAS